MDDEIEEPTDGSFTTRFSASRLRQVAEKHLNDDKRGILNDCNFVSLMNISPFYVPDELLDRVVMKIDPKQGLFSHKEKDIFVLEKVRNHEIVTIERSWVLL